MDTNLARASRTFSPSPLGVTVPSANAYLEPKETLLQRFRANPSVQVGKFRAEPGQVGIPPGAAAARARGIALPLPARPTVIYALVTQVGGQPGRLARLGELRRRERRTAQPRGRFRPARRAPASPPGAPGRGVSSFPCFGGVYLNSNPLMNGTPMSTLGSVWPSLEWVLAAAGCSGCELLRGHRAPRPGERTVGTSRPRVQREPPRNRWREEGQAVCLGNALSLIIYFKT